MPYFGENVADSLKQKRKCNLLFQLLF